MRRTSLILSALGPLLLVGGPAAAHPPAAVSAVSASPMSSVVSDGGWEPAPSEPWELEAGERCDFPVRGEPLVDQVVRRVVWTHPDQTPKRVVYKGALILRITHGETGATYDADVSGTAVVDYATDGSQRWRVVGPVLVGVGEGGGNLPRGLHVVDGRYTMDISADGDKDIDLTHATHMDTCDRLD